MPRPAGQGVGTWCERRGVGRALLVAAAAEAAAMGCSRLWLITTNDNLPALRFYQRLGWDLVALHRGAVNEAGVGAATALNMLRPG